MKYLLGDGTTGLKDEMRWKSIALVHSDMIFDYNNGDIKQLLYLLIDTSA